MGHSPWDCQELDTTEQLSLFISVAVILCFFLLFTRQADLSSFPSAPWFLLAFPSASVGVAADLCGSRVSSRPRVQLGCPGACAGEPTGGFCPGTAREEGEAGPCRDPQGHSLGLGSVAARDQ